MSHVPTTGTKVCRTCKVRKDVDQFRVFRRQGDPDREYRRSYCRECDRKYAKRWRDARPGYHAEKARIARAVARLQAAKIGLKDEDDWLVDALVRGGLVEARRAVKRIALALALVSEGSRPRAAAFLKCSTAEYWREFGTGYPDITDLTRLPRPIR